MSKRDSMTAFELIVVELSNRNLLTKELLCVIWKKMAEYMDMDAGGYTYAENTKGQVMPEIVCELLDVNLVAYWPKEEYAKEELLATSDDELVARKAEMYFWDILHEETNWENL